MDWYYLRHLLPAAHTNHHHIFPVELLGVCCRDASVIRTDYDGVLKNYRICCPVGANLILKTVFGTSLVRIENVFHRYPQLALSAHSMYLIVLYKFFF
jgi:hypothetical protein